MKYTGGLFALIAAVSLAAAGESAVTSDTPRTRLVPDTIPHVPRDTMLPTPGDTVPSLGVRLRIGRDSLPFRLPTVRSLSERESFRLAREQIAAARATAFQQNVRSIMESTWGQVQARTFATQARGAAFPDELPPKPPSGVAERAASLLGDYTDLSVDLDGRVEFRAERAVNERCSAVGGFDPVIGCRTGFEPLFDFQASLRSGGVVANRIHVNVDYDSQREFDASNNISIYYQGREKDLLERFEIGNVTFQPPRSRFITAGIPSNNTGLQAITRLGPMRLKAIMAQQKGNIVADRVFTVGDRALQEVERSLEDYQFEPRRFFFTVDPRTIRGYPNVDILDSRALETAAALLPDTLRPARLFVYRLLIGAQPATPSGPQFRLIGDPRSRRGQVYEYLREGIDYYADPSLLWISLVRPLSIDRERLVVAYRVRVNGRDTTHVTTGGTPDLEFSSQREQFANLLWDPQVAPGDPAFNREIRSVYRVGGTGIVRPSVSVKIVTSAGTDHEKPFGGGAETFLEAFGLAQETNSSTFDFENRLWPRPSDPNLQVGFSTTSARMIGDQFLIFPSVRPFGSDGLAIANPANDAIYTTPSEHLNTAQRPRALYHMRIRYQAEGGGDAGGLMLGSVQLRPSSERLHVDGILLTRGVDYTVDYDLGRVTFARPDTLFPRPRQVSVQYEENPLFADTPTSITGAAAEFLMERGQISFTAISQSQKTTFNRPPLGFEPAASLVAGVSGLFDFDAEPLTRLVSRLPYGRTSVPSRVSVSGELAMSRPRPNFAGQAFIESFEGEGGIHVPLTDGTWYYSSQPALGTALPLRLGSDALALDRAATLAWQSAGLDVSGRPVQYTIRQIDPQTELFGTGVAGPETLLWMTLYPLSVGGLYNPEKRVFQWKTPDSGTGRRWRSIRTVLGPSGVDLSRVENLEFWAQVDTSATARVRNPLLVFDFGDVSENTVLFSPDTLRLVKGPADAVDSVYSGRAIRGLDRLDSERDPFSRAFNVTSDDIGLPGDRVRGITLFRAGSDATQGGETVGAHSVCTGGARFSQLLGDARVNCTVANNRLDEEDINFDNVLNLTQAERDQERWRRYVVDLANPESYNRVGRCAPAPRTFTGTASPSVCWVLIRVPFRSPDDSLGDALLRRVRALRLTMIAGAQSAEDEFLRVPLARLRLTGAPWLKRDDKPLVGISGEQPASGGYVIAGVIGTQDRNRTGGIDYESPPGVTDEPDTKTVALSSARVQINERSLRLTAGGLERYQRAEAYYRFPEGQKNFMGYKQLRLWARGINGGWGADGELHFYVKVGRDPNNFYMYRAPLNGGLTRAAWLPEIRVDFQKFFLLRAQIQNAFLGGTRPNTCTGLDSVLIANTPASADGAQERYAACSDGYIAYTVAPGSSAPNLATVQELAVGMVRVADGGGIRPIAPGDTLELWVNDIRLADVVDEMGIAGQFAASIVASDFGDIRLSFSRRDPHFRQLAEQPGYLTDNAVDISAAFRLEKLLPRSLGLSIPLTLSYTSLASDPLFLSQSDIQAQAVEGLRSPRSSAASYTVSVRRTVPLEDHFLAPVLNNLVLNSSYTSASARSEFQEGGARNFSLGAELNVTRALLPKLSRWSPAELYLTSVYRKGSDERFSYFRPASVPEERPSPVVGVSHTWRNGAVLAFKPMETLRARFDLSSVRDLRDYDPDTPLGIVAESEGQSLAGVEAGLERERAIQSSINFAPALRPWIRPRLDFASTYHMIRDPNTLYYTDIVLPEGAREHRLPRRLANSQVLNSGLSFDLPGALAFLGDSTLWLRRALRGLRPFEVALNRHVVSVFEGTAVDPPLSYQFALGGAGRFLNVKGSPATSAAVTNHLSIGNSWQLPFGARITSRYQQHTMRHWIRRLEGGTTTTDGTQVIFPDVGVQWSGRPRGLGWLWSSVGVTARAQETDQRFGTPDPESAGTDDRSDSRFRSYPVNLSLTWALVPGLATSGGFSRVRRMESKPGVDSRSRNTDYNVDVALPLRLPAGEGKSRDVRTRFGYQSGQGSSFVINPLALNNTSRLFESGRRALTLSADTDVGENLASSFLISRVSSFDRNFNREITQTVLSAVLHLQFFGGEMK